jgi:flagellar biosynthesis chaperone FliJ
VATVTTLNAQAAPLIQAGRTQAAASNTLAPAISQQLAALEAQRGQAVLNHIQQLQNGFTAQRFQLLDAFIRATSKTKAVSIQVQKAAK